MLQGPSQGRKVDKFAGMRSRRKCYILSMFFLGGKSANPGSPGMKRNFGDRKEVLTCVGGKQTERKTPMKTNLTAFSIFQSLIEAHTHTNN